MSSESVTRDWHTVQDEEHILLDCPHEHLVSLCNMWQLTYKLATAPCKFIRLSLLNAHSGNPCRKIQALDLVFQQFFTCGLLSNELYPRETQLCLGQPEQ